VEKTEGEKGRVGGGLCKATRLRICTNSLSSIHPSIYTRRSLSLPLSFFSLTSIPLVSALFPAGRLSFLRPPLPLFLCLALSPLPVFQAANPKPLGEKPMYKAIAWGREDARKKGTRPGDSGLTVVVAASLLSHPSPTLAACLLACLLACFSLANHVSRMLLLLLLLLLLFLLQNEPNARSASRSKGTRAS
jgi:hypothetical protein